MGLAAAVTHDQRRFGRARRPRDWEPPGGAAARPGGQQRGRSAARAVQRRGTQSRRLYRLPGLFIGGGWHRAFGKNHFVARVGPVFVADLSEKRGETVIILLAPFLERMMMTLRALQSHAEEKLRGVFEFRLRFAHLTIPGDGGVVLDVTRLECVLEALTRLGTSLQSDLEIALELFQPLWSQQDRFS